MTDLIEHEPRPSTARRAGFIAVATAAAVAVGGVAYAATGSSTPTPAPQSSTAGPQGPTQLAPGAPGPLGQHMMRGGEHGPGMLGMRGGVLHGEFTVAKPGGGYQTVEVQRGDVTSVSSSSITVKSADGVSTTYTVTADTMVNAARDGIATVKTGHTVEILATVSGNTATAQHIRDTTLAKANRQHWLPQPPAGGGGADGGNGQSSGSGT